LTLVLYARDQRFVPPVTQPAKELKVCVTPAMLSFCKLLNNSRTCVFIELASAGSRSDLMYPRQVNARAVSADERREAVNRPDDSRLHLDLFLALTFDLVGFACTRVAARASNCNCAQSHKYDRRDSQKSVLLAIGFILATTASHSLTAPPPGLGVSNP
jgi:hypothetical protein